MAPPKRSKKSEGFHSAAGLIRYFDAEEEVAMKIDPRLVIGLAITAAIVIEFVRYYFPI